MNLAKPLRTCAVLAALACLPAVRAQSASPEDRLRDALRQTTLQLREAQDQNAELQAKQQALEQQLAGAQSKPKPQAPAADTREVAHLRQELQDKDATVTQLQQQLQQSQQSLAQWQQARQEAVDVARKQNADAVKYQSQFQDSDTHLHSCEQKNAQLYSIADELLERYKNKGMWASLRDEEPLTQIQRVQLEKLAQDYHGKMVDQKVQPETAPAQP